jgi:hypothetical protein
MTKKARLLNPEIYIILFFLTEIKIATQTISIYISFSLDLKGL